MRSVTQGGAGGLADGRDDAPGDRFDVGIGERPLDRLQDDGDGEGFVAAADRLAGEDIEQDDVGDQRRIGAPGGLQNRRGGDVGPDDEGEIPLHRLQRCEGERRPGGAPPARGKGMASQ